MSTKKGSSHQVWQEASQEEFQSDAKYLLRELFPDVSDEELQKMSETMANTSEEEEEVGRKHRITPIEKPAKTTQIGETGY